MLPARLICGRNLFSTLWLITPSTAIVVVCRAHGAIKSGFEHWIRGRRFQVATTNDRRCRHAVIQISAMQCKFARQAFFHMWHYLYHPPSLCVPSLYGVQWILTLSMFANSALFCKKHVHCIVHRSVLAASRPHKLCKTSVCCSWNWFDMGIFLPLNTPTSNAAVLWCIALHSTRTCVFSSCQSSLSLDWILSAELFGTRERNRSGDALTAAICITDSHQPCQRISLCWSQSATGLVVEVLNTGWPSDAELRFVDNIDDNRHHKLSCWCVNLLITRNR